MGDHQREQGSMWYLATRTLLAVLAAAAVACISSRGAEIESARRADVNRIAELGRSKMVMSFCDGATTPSKTSYHVVDQNGVSVRQPCGMVTVDILTQDAINTFIASVCGGTDSLECGQALWSMFVARLQERYAFADWDWVVNKCKAYPIECKQWMNIEFWATESHDEEVLGWTRKAIDEANVRRQAEYEQAYREETEQRRRLGAAIQGFAAGLNPPRQSIHCSSQTVGDMTFTNCR